MTKKRALNAKSLRDYCQVARDEGVTITVEAGGRVYRFTPSVQLSPMTTTEGEKAECDEAFGVSD